MTRAVVGIVIALLVLVWPHRTDQILARLLGAGLMIASATSFWGAVRHEPRQFLRGCRVCPTSAIAQLRVSASAGRIVTRRR